MQADATAYPNYRTITFGDFSVRPEQHLLLKAGKPVPIGARALEILIALLEQPGKLVTKDKLVARVWPKNVIEESNLRVQVAVLRKTLDNGRDGAAFSSDRCLNCTHRLKTAAKSWLARIFCLAALRT